MRGVDKFLSCTIIRRTFTLKGVKKMLIFHVWGSKRIFWLCEGVHNVSYFILNSITPLLLGYKWPTPYTTISEYISYFILFRGLEIHNLNAHLIEIIKMFNICGSKNDILRSVHICYKRRRVGRITHSSKGPKMQTRL